MSKWKKINGEYTTTYTREREAIAKFLESKGSVDSDFKDYYKSMYDQDYPYPVKISIYKTISMIYYFLVILFMFFAPLFNNSVILIVSLSLLVFGFITFGFVRKVKYPNERYPVLYLITTSFLTIMVLFTYYLCKYSMIPELECLDFVYGYPSMFNIFIIVSCSISFVILTLGLILGRRRFGSANTPLVVISGWLLFAFIFNILLDSNLNNEILSFILSIIAMLIFDVGLMLISRAIGGKKHWLR